MNKQRRTFLRVGTAKLAGLVCATAAASAMAASPSYAGGDKPIGLLGPASPDERQACPYCSNNLDCPTHLT